MFIWEYIKQYYFALTFPCMPFTEATFWLCCIIIFYRPKFKLKSVISVIVQFFIIWFFFIIIKACLREIGFNLTYVYFICSAPYALIAGRKKFVNTLIYLCVFWTAYVYATVFAKSLGGVLFNYMLGVEYTNTASYICIGIVVPITLIVHTVMIRVFPLEKFAQVGTLYILLPLVVDVFANIAKILVDNIKEDGLPFFGLEESENSLFIFLSGVLLYLLNFFSYCFVYNQSKTLEKAKAVDEKLDTLQRDKRNLMDSKEIFMNSIEEMRQIRHDIKNQLAYLQIMLESKDYSSMETYFKKLNDNFSVTLNLSDCENPTVRNVLNMEKYKAKCNDITIDSKIIVPINLSVSDVDLTTILLNLLDNAIEACIEDCCENPVIECKMQLKGSYLFINVINPVKDTAKNGQRMKLETGKDEKELHGRGTKIIAATAKKYNGAFTYKIENDKFIADVMLAC